MEAVYGDAGGRARGGDRAALPSQRDVCRGPSGACRTAWRRPTQAERAAAFADVVGPPARRARSAAGERLRAPAAAGAPRTRAVLGAAGSTRRSSRRVRRGRAHRRRRRPALRPPTISPRSSWRSTRPAASTTVRSRWREQGLEYVGERRDATWAILKAYRHHRARDQRSRSPWHSRWTRPSGARSPRICRARCECTRSIPLRRSTPGVAGRHRSRRAVTRGPVRRGRVSSRPVRAAAREATERRAPRKDRAAPSSLMGQRLTLPRRAGRVRRGAGGSAAGGGARRRSARAVVVLTAAARSARRTNGDWRWTTTGMLPSRTSGPASATDWSAPGTEAPHPGSDRPHARAHGHVERGHAAACRRCCRPSSARPAGPRTTRASSAMRPRRCGSPSARIRSRSSSATCARR